MKSARTCPLIAVLGAYLIPKAEISMDHLANLPNLSTLSRAFSSGMSVSTVIGCASKYGLSFRLATTTVYAHFSIKEYLDSGPDRVWLLNLVLLFH